MVHIPPPPLLPQPSYSPHPFHLLSPSLSSPLSSSPLSSSSLVLVPAEWGASLAAAAMLAAAMQAAMGPRLSRPPPGPRPPFSGGRRWPGGLGADADAPAQKPVAA